MNYIELFFPLIVLLFLIIFVILYLNGLINSIKYKVPQVGTFSSDFKVMKKYLGKYNLSGKKIIDLGSGTGKALRFFEKQFGMKVTGIEVDFSNAIISKVMNYFFGRKAKIIIGNYLRDDLSVYDVVYVYQFNVLMPDIEKKLWGNCKEGTLVISNAFKMPNKIPVEILFNDKGKEELYIYKV